MLVNSVVKSEDGSITIHKNSKYYALASCIFLLHGMDLNESFPTQEIIKEVPKPIGWYEAEMEKYYDKSHLGKPRPSYDSQRGNSTSIKQSINPEYHKWIWSNMTRLRVNHGIITRFDIAMYTGKSEGAVSRLIEKGRKAKVFSLAKDLDEEFEAFKAVHPTTVQVYADEFMPYLEQEWPRFAR